MPTHNVGALTTTTVAGNTCKTISCACNTQYNIPGLDATSSQYAAIQSTLNAHAATAH